MRRRKLLSKLSGAVLFSDQEQSVFEDGRRYCRWDRTEIDSIRPECLTVISTQSEELVCIDTDNSPRVIGEALFCLRAIVNR